MDIRWRVFFWNFVWNRDPLELPELGARIRLGTEEEFYDLVGDGLHIDYEFIGLASPVQDVGGVLEIHRQWKDFADPALGDHWRLGSDTARKVLLGLRLVQPHWIEQESIITDSSNFLNSGYLGGRYRSSYGRAPQGQREPFYSLDDEAVSKLNRILPLIGYSSQLPELQVPIARYGDSYRRAQSYDRHLDYWLALESMLIESDRDLTQTLAAAIAFYLYDSDEDRETTRSRVKQSYDLRSQLIHGARHLIPWADDIRYSERDRQPKAGAPTRGELVEFTRAWSQEVLAKRIQEWNAVPRLR